MCGPSERVSSSDSELSLNGSNTPQRHSMCSDQEDGDRSTQSPSPEEANTELAANQSDDSGVGATKSDAVSQELTSLPDSVMQGLDQGTVDDPPSVEVKTKPAPVPAPRLSFRITDQLPLLPTEDTDTNSVILETSESRDGVSSHNPPGFLYKVCNTEVFAVRDVLFGIRSSG